MSINVAYEMYINLLNNDKEGFLTYYKMANEDIPHGYNIEPNYGEELNERFKRFIQE